LLAVFLGDVHVWRFHGLFCRGPAPGPPAGFGRVPRETKAGFVKIWIDWGGPKKKGVRERWARKECFRPGSPRRFPNRVGTRQTPGPPVSLDGSSKKKNHSMNPCQSRPGIHRQNKQLNRPPGAPDHGRRGSRPPPPKGPGNRSIASKGENGFHGGFFSSKPKFRKPQEMRPRTKKVGIFPEPPIMGDPPPKGPIGENPFPPPSGV